MNQYVHIYDTTLRDGTQREGISLSLADKLDVACDEANVKRVNTHQPVG